MIALAHFLAICCYVGAAAVAATPFARPVEAPVRGVVGVLAAGVLLHLAGLCAFALHADAMPLTGLGPSLSFAGLVLALTLVVVELLAREVSLTLVAGPLAALPTTCALIVGLTPGLEPAGTRGVWLFAHITLSFIGIAAFATAAAAGTMYLIEHRELRSRRFGAIFRFFPPLATLDRVNHVSAIAGWLVLTPGIVLAVTYSIFYRQANVPQIVWGTGAWVAVSSVAVGRVLGGWQARRAALYSTLTFAAVLVLYLAFRIAAPGVGAGGGKFL
jgi:ABC-type uncharacterized transport system permease subunit